MRRRDRTPLPEDVARDLAAIDAALAGDTADGELALLAIDVRDQRPRPDAGVIARLDARAADGFAPQTGAPRRRRSILPALAAAGALLVALVVGVTALNGPGDDRSGGSVALTQPAREPATAREALPTDDNASAGGDATAQKVAPSVSEAAPPLSASAPAPAPARSVERGATLALVTTPGKLDEIASGVVRTTDDLRGYVVSSAVESRGTGGSATFDLRVPAAQLQPALARLSKLARVRSRTESSLDITGAVVASRERVDALSAERRGVLRQLAAATTPAETEQARERLRIIDMRLARAQAARLQLRRRAAYSTINVEIATRRPSAGAVTGGGTWTPGDALHDAVRVLSIALGAALIAFAALLPAGLLAAALWGTWRIVLSRRRNGALDGAN